MLLFIIFGRGGVCITIWGGDRSKGRGKGNREGESWIKLLLGYRGVVK